MTTADNRPWFKPCICGGTMARTPETTGSEAGYRCIACGHFQPDNPVSWIPRQTPCVSDKKEVTE